MLQNIMTINFRSKTIVYLAADFLVLCFIYLIPTFSHLTTIPFYLFDPMRLALVFCIIYTGRKNSLLIALTIPLISLLISSHPVLIKGIIISAELMLNVIVFYILSKRLNNLFVVMFVSILIAKVFYYSVKMVLLISGLIHGNLVSTPLWIQIVMMFVLSILTFISFRKSGELTAK